MNEEKTFDDVLDAARGADPFIPLPTAEQYVREHGARKSFPFFRAHPFRNALAVSAAAVCIGLMIFFFNKNHETASPLRTQPSEETRTQPETQPQQSSGPQTEKATGRLPEEKGFAARVKSQRDTAAGVLSASRFSAPLIIPVSWSQEKIRPFRIYILDSMELADIGILLLNDGTIATGFTNPPHVEKYFNGASITSMYQPTSRNDTLAVDLRIRQNIGRPAREIPSPDVKKHIGVKERWDNFCMLHWSGQLKISDAEQTDEFGRVLQFSDNVSGSAMPDFKRTQPMAETGRHIDYCFDNLDPALQNLFPVLVRTTNQTKIFWMRLNSDLIMKLPEWIQKDLRERDNDPKIKKSSGPAPRKGNDILFTLTSSPTPETNPSVELTLDGDRELGMALYDIWGSRVKELTPLQHFAKGEWKQEVNVKDMPKGIYLFAVVSRDGQQTVQRICVP
jgi:hypothetical protein